VNYDMARVMSNLEHFMNTKNRDDAFKAIKSFSISKKMAVTKLKKRSTLDIVSLITQRHIKVSRKYFYLFKYKIFNKKQRITRLKGIFGNMNS
jgi:hypothetical protein